MAIVDFGAGLFSTTREGNWQGEPGLYVELPIEQLSVTEKLIFEESRRGAMSKQQNHALRADNHINSPYKRASRRWVGLIYG